MAGQVNFELDQGADFAAQIYNTDETNRPFYLVAPMRMEVRDPYGSVAVTLQTNETSEDAESNPDNQSILFNSESGLIQLQITADQTDTMAGGTYKYDLFVSYVDIKGSGAVRKKRLIFGEITVNGKVTQNA